MAISVTLNDNPVVPDVGTTAIDTVTINSGFSGVTAYHIRRRDGQKINNKYTDIRVTSDAASNMDDIIYISGSKITLRLDFRTKYKVRVMNQSSPAATWGSWSGWHKFKTRDKRYQSPDAISQLSTNSLDANPTAKENITIVVNNTAKATVTNTSRGATVGHEYTRFVGGKNTRSVWQQSKIYNGTTFTRNTSRGAEVLNVNNDRGN